MESTNFDASSLFRKENRCSSFAGGAKLFIDGKDSLSPNTHLPGVFELRLQGLATKATPGLVLWRMIGIEPRISPSLSLNVDATLDAYPFPKSTDHGPSRLIFPFEERMEDRELNP